MYFMKIFSGFRKSTDKSFFMISFIVYLVVLV